MSTHGAERGRESLEGRLLTRFRELAKIESERWGIAPTEEDFLNWFNTNRADIETKEPQGLKYLVIENLGASIEQYRQILDIETRWALQGGTLRDSKGRKVIGNPYGGNAAYPYDSAWQDTSGEDTQPKFGFFMTENLPELIRAGQERTIKGRMQFRTGRSAIENEQLITGSQYQGESFITKRQYLAYAASNVRDGRLIDTETYTIIAGVEERTAAGDAPGSSWLPDYVQFNLGSDPPRFLWVDGGVRVAVGGK
jgi:hypothetical protein